MKKSLFYLVFLFIMTVGNAQDAATQPASGASPTGGRFGIWAAYNLCSVTGESESWEGGYSGFGVGFMYCVARLGNITYIWVEPGYNQVGSNWEESFSGQNYSGSVALSYISLPIIARFQTEGGLFGDIGFQPQVLVAAKDKYDGNSEDYKDYVNSFDFMIPIGAGYEFKKRFGISARYCIGVTNINKESDESDRNSVFSVRLHMRLGK